jgi:2-phospho-L-lactate/phosphoenolpyruvate guanylyltransferase
MNSTSKRSTGLVAVVPVRGLRGGKRRLSDLFDEDERAVLTCAMLRRVLVALRDAGVVDRVAVVTPDPAVASAFPMPADGIELVRQPEGQSGLNQALLIGRGWAAGRGAGRLLVLSADLPLLHADDIRNLAYMDHPAGHGVPVILATDRHGTGTNGLLLREPDAEAFTFGFGEHSALRHVAEADRLGLSVVRTATSGTAFDLDTPDDWDALPAEVRDVLAPVCRGANYQEAVTCR